MRLVRREERLMWKLIGTGSRRGSSPASRAGDLLRMPLLWHAFALALSRTGPRGRRAALRGSACSAVAVLLHLPVKRVVRRRRPLGSRMMGLGPLTSSFPSGHTANDLSFMLGASQEIPPLAIPLSLATMGSHWSLIRSRKHYPSDIVGGGAIAIAVAATAWFVRPPRWAGRRDDGRRAGHRGRMDRAGPMN